MSSWIPPTTGTNIPHRGIFASDLSSGLHIGRYLSLKPSSAPHILQNGTQAAPVSIPTFPTAVADNVDSLVFGEGPFHSYIEMYQTTAQTIMPSIFVNRAKGLEIALDQVNNESVEYVPGGNSVANPFLCTVGTDPGVFIRAIFEVTTAAGLDQFVIGFRKRENYVVPTSFLNAGAAGYTDFAAMGFASAVATPNPIFTTTSVASAANIATTTGFTIPNAGVYQLEVRVIGGKAIYLINGVRVGDPIAKDGLGAAITSQSTTTPPAYTFTAGLQLIPFIFLRQDAALSVVFLSNRHATRPGLVVGQLLEDGLAPDQKQ